MPTISDLAGTFTFAGTTRTIHRMGYGAMQLAGPGVFGPPKDETTALAVLRETVESGVDHIDTSDFYGPYVTNQLIRKALHPYPAHLTLVTKVGARRGEDGSWIHDFSPDFLERSVHDNLRHLGLDSLAVVNLRALGLQKAEEQQIAEPLGVLARLQEQGLIENIGLSNISPKQFEEASPIAKIVCVQNYYNVASRHDDAFIDQLHREGVAYVPYFPLGGPIPFQPQQASTLAEVASTLSSTPMAVALAWLLQRSPNILLIPGTSSPAHLRENLAAAALRLPPEALRTLDAIGQSALSQ